MLMKKKTIFLMACCLTSALFCGCTGSTVSKSGNTTSVIDYEYTEQSKAYISFSDNRDKKIDVSGSVTGYNSGDLTLTGAGLEAAFGLKKVDVSEEDTRLFEQYETENNFSGETGEIIKLRNENYTLLFREGSTLFLCNKELKNLASPISKTDSGEVAYPMFDIVFALGYESIGTSISDNDITYVVYLPVADEEKPLLENVAPDAEAVEPETLTETAAPEDAAAESLEATEAAEVVEESGAETTESVPEETVAEGETTADETQAAETTAEAETVAAN